MNLSSLFKNNQSILLFVALLGIAIYALVIANFILFGIIALLLVAVPFVPSAQSTGATSTLSNNMKKVLQDAAAGKLEGRVTHIPDNNSEESQFAWALNNVLDQLEAFMRDTAITIENAAAGKTYRRTYASGLHGIFKVTAIELNKAIKSIASGYETRIQGELSHSFSKLGGGIGEGLMIIQEDLSISSEDAKSIVEVAQHTADESSNSLSSVVEIGERLNKLVDLIASSHEGIVGL